MLFFLLLHVFDIVFTIFVVNLAARFFFGRIHGVSRSSHCQAGSSNAQSARVFGPQCRGRGSNPAFGQHPFQHPFHPFFNVIELEIPQNATSNTTTPTSPSAPVPQKPAHTFTETPSTYILAAEVPGFSRSQLTLSVKDDIRQIKVEGKNDARRPVELTVTIPRLGDLSSLTAVVEDGILNVIVPKLERDGRVVNVAIGSAAVPTQTPAPAQKSEEKDGGFYVVA